ARNKTVKAKRNKKQKSQKQAAKKHNTLHTSSALGSAQKVEKTLLKTPSKLVAQLKKEISACKKVEARLKKTVGKNKMLADKTASRLHALNAKGTPTSKKKINKAKKLLTQTTKTNTELSKQLDNTTKTLTTLLT